MNNGLNDAAQFFPMKYTAQSILKDWKGISLKNGSADVLLKVLYQRGKWLEFCQAWAISELFKSFAWKNSMIFNKN